MIRAGRPVKTSFDMSRERSVEGGNEELIQLGAGYLLLRDVNGRIFSEEFERYPKQRTGRNDREMNQGLRQKV